MVGRPGSTTGLWTARGYLTCKVMPYLGRTSLLLGLTACIAVAGCSQGESGEGGVIPMADEPTTGKNDDPSSSSETDSSHGNPDGGDDESGGPEDDSGDGAGTGTGGDTDGPETTGAMPEARPRLLQAAFNPDSGTYEFGFDSLESVEIGGAPGDTDWGRWAMLHDGQSYWLYFMPQDRDDALYPFVFDPDVGAYEHTDEMLDIVDAPSDADMSSIAMLHDGTNYRLYALSLSNPLSVHQFSYDKATAAYVYGHDSIPEIEVTATPQGADWGAWATVGDGADYRLYTFASAARDTLVQHAYNPDTGTYEYGFNGISDIPVGPIPPDALTGDMAMVHDGQRYRLYLLADRR